MNKGVLMQINCSMSLEATKLSNKAKHVDTSKAIRVVAEVLNPKNIKPNRGIDVGTYQQESIEYGNVVHEILSFVKTKMTLI
jgi:hypothetical protein